MARCLFLLAIVAWLSPAGAYEPSAGLLFLGDIMLGRGVAQARAGEGWDSVLSTLHPFTRSADLAFANLESPIDCRPPEPSGPRTLAAPPESAGALSAAGLDILSAINNHALDAGAEGRRCTAEILSARGIRVLQSASRPVEAEVHGLRILLLGADLLSETANGDLEVIIGAAREASAEGKIVVVSLHWGMEYQSGRDSLQRRVAEELAAAGADIVWGHHPHAVQQVEWIGHTLVLYSLGNAVFDQRYPASVRRGQLDWVEIDRSGVRRVWILPFAIDVIHGRTGPVDWRSLRAADNPRPALGE